MRDRIEPTWVFGAFVRRVGKSFVLALSLWVAVDPYWFVYVFVVSNFFSFLTILLEE